MYKGKLSHLVQCQSIRTAETVVPMMCCRPVSEVTKTHSNTQKYLMPAASLAESTKLDMKLVNCLFWISLSYGNISDLAVKHAVVYLLHHPDGTRHHARPTCNYTVGDEVQKRSCC